MCAFVCVCVLFGVIFIFFKIYYFQFTRSSREFTWETRDHHVCSYSITHYIFCVGAPSPLASFITHNLSKKPPSHCSSLFSPALLLPLERTPTGIGCTWFLWEAGDTVFVFVVDFVNNVISNDDPDEPPRLRPVGSTAAVGTRKCRSKYALDCVVHSWSTSCLHNGHDLFCFITFAQVHLPC